MRLVAIHDTQCRFTQLLGCNSLQTTFHIRVFTFHSVRFDFSTFIHIGEKSVCHKTFCSLSTHKLSTVGNLVDCFKIFPTHIPRIFALCFPLYEVSKFAGKILLKSEISEFSTLSLSSTTTPAKELIYIKKKQEKRSRGGEAPAIK